MAFYERDKEGKLVPITEVVPEEAVRGIERYDEQAIVQRLTTGLARQEFIYHYPIKTATGVKEVIGISTDGADEIARMLGNIEVLPDIKMDKDSDPDYFYAMVRAKDLIRNVTLLGVGRSCKYQIGKGNLPDHDRPNEWAFVSSVSKAQRNAVLHQTPEEIIIRIINTWMKEGKGKQLIPPRLEVEAEETALAPAPIPAPAPAPRATVAAQQIVDQQEKLKKLRMQVHNRFQTDLGIGVDERKELLQKNWGVGSLSDMNEQQLNECLSYIEKEIETRTVAPTPAPAKTKDDTAKSLGFESLDEQNKLRGRLYSILTSPNQLNLKDEEAKKFIADRKFTATTNIPKAALLALIQEANELVKVRQTPTEF